MSKKIILYVIIVVILLCGCQPTPEEEIVVSKAGGLVEEISKETDKPMEKLITPSIWVSNQEYYEGKLTVNINADIFVPDINQYSIYEVQPIGFTQSQTEKLIKVLLNDQPIKVASQRWTKSQLEELIVKVRANWESGDDMGMSDEEYERSVEDLEKRWVTAPTTIEKTDLETHIESFSETGRIDVQGELGREKPATLLILNAGRLQASKVLFKNNDGIAFNTISIDDLDLAINISIEEAIKKAEKILAEIGIDYMTVTSVNIGAAYDGEKDTISDFPQCYLVNFTRSVNGVDTTFDYRDGDASNDKQYDIPWSYERKAIGIDDKGIVSFSWDGNAKITKTISESAMLMPFESIMDIFEKNMGIQYAYYNEDKSIYSVVYDINRITLGLTRIKVPESRYILIPVWDFFGDRTIISTDHEGNKSEYKLNGDFRCESFLTINTIDGTLIDRSLGY